MPTKSSALCNASFYACVLLITALQSVSSAVADEAWTVEIRKDVSYLSEGRDEKLDLYLPRSTDKEPSSTPHPAVVIIHGGGWHGGDKAAAREQNIGTTLAAAGFVCASINYELCDKTDDIAARLNQVWPRNLYDCKTAVRYLRKHADEYQIDPNYIGAIGGSAGGHLVAMLATTDVQDGLDPEGPDGKFSCRIQAVVPMYGVHDVIEQVKVREQFVGMSEVDRRLCRAASPISYITPDDPPALILHGTNDALVPTEQSIILHAALLDSKVESHLDIIEGAPHSFHLQPKQEDLRSTVISFFTRHLRPE